MDQTARIWDIEKGKCVTTLSGHSGEIVALHFNSEGDKIITASFDNTARVIYIFIKSRFGMFTPENV